jgi:hypothetical protein
MEEMDRKESGRRALSGKRARIGLVAGGAVLGIVLACVIGGVMFISLNATTQGYGASNDLARWAPGTEPEIVEVLVEREAAMAPMEEAAADASYRVTGLAQAPERLIIRNGNISMVVEDTRAVQGTVEEMVARMAGEGAFVVSSEEYGRSGEGQPRITMSIRVPVGSFDEVMDRLAALAVKVTSRNESGQDVTEEYVDLEARLESLEAARQRLLDIMAEARTTKDLLEAEEQLTRREAEIESIQGRMQYLAQSAQLSAIWIELEPYLLRQPVSDTWRPAETARRAVEALVDGLQGFGDFLIFFAIAVLPWLLALGLVVFVVVWLVRWRSRARRKKGAAESEGSDPVA